MASVKYQFFVSSTFSDLQEERRIIIKSILDLGQIASGMEAFPAADVAAMSYIERIIDECDYYIIVVGARYGSVGKDGISFTEMEYDYAEKQGKFILSFLHEDPLSISVAKSDTSPDLIERLAASRKKILSGRLCKFWSSKDNLLTAVLPSIAQAMRDAPGVGWVRGDTVANDETLQANVKLAAENKELRQRIGELVKHSAPKIENLVPLYENFPLQYSYKEIINGNSYKQKSVKRMSLAEIFLVFGPQLMKPVNPAKIESSLRDHIAATNDRSGIVFASRQMAQIKLHFIAANLIQSRQTVAVGAGLAEFVEITKLGEKTLLELAAIRQKSDPATSALSPDAPSSPD